MGERKITRTKNRNVCGQTKNNMVANAMCAKKNQPKPKTAYQLVFAVIEAR